MDLLEQFRQFLKNEGVSTNTLKNYVSDLSTFVDYLKSVNQYFSIITLPFVLNTDTLNSYKKWLQLHFPLSTGNRRLSAIRKFIEFAIENDLTSKDYTGSITNFIIPNPADDDIRNIVKIIPSELSDTKEVIQYKNDINDYLVSTNRTPALSPSKFRLSRFLNWKKDQITDSTKSIPPAAISPFNFRLLFTSISLLATITVTAIIIIGHPGALQKVVSKARFPVNLHLSLNAPVNQLVSDIGIASEKVLGVQDLIDPLSKPTPKKTLYPPLQTKIAYIIQYLFKPSPLLDPLK